MRNFARKGRKGTRIQKNETPHNGLILLKKSVFILLSNPFHMKFLALSIKNLGKNINKKT
jgi:hypothetical protein